MQYRHSIDIDAPPADVWAALIDVERWPDWTPTMTDVELLDAAALALDARIRIKQPRLPAVEWRVSSFDEGRGFAWQAPGFGATTTAGHTIEARGEGSRVTLSITTSGRLAPLSWPITGLLARRWVPREAAGLRDFCEGASS